MNDLLNILRLGASMRDAQKRYFRTRRDDDLNHAKALENEFDRQARKALDTAPVQGALFAKDSEPAPDSRARWIRITERLPRLTHESCDGEFCFSNRVLARYEEVGTPGVPATTATYYDDGRWEDETGFPLSVVAWMPSPAFEGETDA